MHKILKESAEPMHQTFKLHCFPELTMGGAADTACSGKNGYTFQKIGSRPSGGSTQPFLPGTAAPEPPEAALEREIAAIEQNAYRKGFSEGEKAGMEMGNRRVTPVIDNFSQALVSLDNVKQALYANAEKKTLELALAVARKIVCHEIQQNRGIILNIIREALDRVVDTDNITIRLNPADHQYINSSGKPLSELFENMEHITFVPDESIVGGGCLIETRMGEIDARIDRQFKVIESLFESEYQKNRQEKA